MHAALGVTGETLIDLFTIVDKYTQKSLRLAVILFPFSVFEDQIYLHLHYIQFLKNLTSNQVQQLQINRKKEVERSLQALAFYTKAFMSKIVYELHTRKVTQRMIAMRDDPDLRITEARLTTSEFRMLFDQLRSMICTCLHLLDRELILIFAIPRYVLLGVPGEVVVDLVDRTVDLQKKLQAYKPAQPVLITEFSCPGVNMKYFWEYWRMVRETWEKERRLFSWFFVQ